MRTLALLTVTLALTGCSTQAKQSAYDQGPPPKSAHVVVDTIKTRTDPKGGLLTPKLRDVYLSGEDEPIVFCSEGPKIPTGEPVTIFYREQKGTSDQSKCLRVIEVVKGRAQWKDGKAKTSEQIQQEKRVAEHLESQLERGSRQLTFAWRETEPVGPPCQDLSGSPYDIKARYERRACSIAVTFEDIDHVLLLNWKIKGDNRSGGTDERGPAPFVEEVVRQIAKRHGDQYTVTGNRASLSATSNNGAVLPPPINQTATIVPYDWDYAGEQNRVMATAWKAAEPAGKPCTDVEGLPGDVAKRLSRLGCSVVIHYPARGSVMFVNWRVPGDTRLTIADRRAGITAKALMMEFKDKFPAYFKSAP